VYLVLSIVLAVAAVTATVITRVKGYFLLLLTAACYPFAAQLAFSGSSSGNLLGLPTPIHLAVLFAPPLLVGCAAVIIAATRSRVPPSPEHGEPGLA
jgi:hypothetical protein